jgi:hypothetical protein
LKVNVVTGRSLGLENSGDYLIKKLEAVDAAKQRHDGRRHLGRLGVGGNQ